VNRSDHSEVSSFFCEQTFVGNHVPDMSLSPRCQWLDADIHAHSEFDADELAPRTVERAEGILAGAGA
jgi:hypothetical protein